MLLSHSLQHLRKRRWENTLASKPVLGSQKLQSKASSHMVFDRIERGELLAICCVLGTTVYFLSRVRRRRSERRVRNNSQEDLRLEVAVSSIESHAQSHGQWISMEQTEDFSNQVAGHTNEKMLSYDGLILKPIIKPLYFWRELSLYYKLLTSGQHWTQSLTPFTATFSGLFIMKRGVAHGERVPGSFYDSKSCRTTQYQQQGASSFLDEHIYYLGLDDLSRNIYKPCVIDLKMGTQTYEPDADESKKRKEFLKCPYQSQVGFRLTGLKVYDVRCNCYGWLSKHFGRSIMPSLAFAAIALCFFDGVNIRKDIVKIVIQKLERIYTWFKNQNRVHFYCSSILIVYEGHVDEEYSKMQYHSGAIHFLRNLPSHFPPTHERQKSLSKGSGVVKNDINDFIDLSKALNVSAEDSEHERDGMTRAFGKSCHLTLEDRVHVKMIDFAHVLPNQGTGLDSGYLKGLSSLITKLHQVMLLEAIDIRRLLLITDENREK